MGNCLFVTPEKSRVPGRFCSNPERLTISGAETSIETDNHASITFGVGLAHGCHNDLTTFREIVIRFIDASYNPMVHAKLSFHDNHCF